MNVSSCHSGRKTATLGGTCIRQQSNSTYNPLASGELKRFIESERWCRTTRSRRSSSVYHQIRHKDRTVSALIVTLTEKLIPWRTQKFDFMSHELWPIWYGPHIICYHLGHMILYFWVFPFRKFRIFSWLFLSVVVIFQLYRQVCIGIGGFSGGIIFPFAA